MKNDILQIFQFSEQKMIVARLMKLCESDELESYRSGMELRSQIEAFAARHAARKVRNGAETRPLLNAFFQLSRIDLLTEPEKFAEADIQMHREILLLSKVPGIVDSWIPVLQKVNRFRMDTLKVCWPDSENLVEAHRMIVDTICQGSEELSAELAIRHQEPVWSRIALLSQNKPTYEDPLERVGVYIQFHYHEGLTLQWLSENVADLSSGHLARLFHTRWKKSFTEYLREIRLKKAAELLRQSSFSIGNIAHLVGYSDVSHFSQHFRQFFGTTPTKYRTGIIQK